VSPVSVGWIGGPRTQIELTYGDNQIQVRYAPGHRSTVRIPVPPQAFDFAPIDALMARLGAGGANRDGAAPPVVAGLAPDLQTLGGMLISALPLYIVGELQRPEMYVELGIAENLLAYPWELMFDDERFLCTRHNSARYINATQVELQATRIPSWWGTPLDTIRVLVISVPGPQPRGGKTFEHLAAVDTEARTVMKALTAIPGCKPTWLPDPSVVDLYRELSSTKYHIVHYCGHAEFGGSGNKQGNLILQSDDMPAQQWKMLMQKTEAVVCVLNGCETARQDAALGGGRYGLARAVLDTGAYLVGTAWKVNDDAARSFAETFYDSFLKRYLSIGVSLRMSREACRTAAPQTAAWASYVLYGDPRLRFAPDGS
jgi:CHAT domain-containing protein